jgi:hypothetical protein
MAIVFTEVRPGDVISSDLMKYVLGKLDEIDGRVSDLETGGLPSDAVAITGFDPPNQVDTGQILTIFGRNFAFPPTDNVVTVDNTRITSFRPGSTGSILSFVVPISISVPSGGKNVRVRVANSQGEDEKLYRLLPGAEAPGDPPVITSVVHAEGEPFIFVNEPIRITGENFAEDPLENIITFQIMTGSGPVIYPKEGETLDIDVGQPDPTEIIVVTVPDIEEVVAGAGSTPVTLQVGVGAHVPAAMNILVRRA